MDVLGLSYDLPRWLVAAFWRERESLRVLALSRVLRVRALRRRAAPPPPGFDPLDFALHRFLDPDAGPARPVTVLLGREWGSVAGALLPTARCRPGPGGGALCRLRASRPEVLSALSASLGRGAGVDSGSSMTVREASSLEARLLRLASLLLREGPVSRERIFEEFAGDYGGRLDAAERKFTRDKEALRRLGYHVETEPLGRDEGQAGYFIDARACALPAVDFGPEEAAVVWTAGAGALRFSDHPLAGELESALRKLVVGGRGLPPRATASVELEPGGTAPGERRLAQVVDAWERRKRVTLGYWRVRSGEVVEREVDVYGWASRRGEWILVGHCHLRGEVRIFYLSRVRSFSVNRRRPGEPDYRVPADFDVRRWSRQQIWDYDVHPPRPAAVRFRGSLARIAKQLLPASRVQTDPEGARVARLEVRNLRGLVRQALAWGPEAEVVEPADGRALAREILAALAGPAEAP